MERIKGPVVFKPLIGAAEGCAGETSVLAAERRNGREERGEKLTEFHGDPFLSQGWCAKGRAWLIIRA